MIEIVAAVLYGVVQGITEFLPVSSSGHLALIPFFTGLEDPGVFFDLAMHVGTALAVMVAFRQDVFLLLQQSVALLKGDRPAFVINFLFATVITVILAFTFKHWGETIARHPLVIAFNLVFFGLIMFIADKKQPMGFSLRHQVDWKRSLFMGVAQGLAVFPGVSRSGATLSAGRFSGMSRHEAGSFSFLLSLPIILGGFFYNSLSLYQSQTMLNFDLSTMFIGVLVSFIVGFATIKMFMSLLKRFSLAVYFWYRIILALVVIYFALLS